MERRRYILRYRGQGSTPGADLARVHDLAGLHVVDASSPKMLLVEAGEQTMADLADSLTDWIISPEHTIALPDSHRHLD